MYHIFFIYSSVDGHLDFFHTLAIVKNAAMNLRMQIAFRYSVFIFFGYIPRRGIAGSSDSSIFNFLRNLHIIFYSSCKILHFHQQCTRVPIFLYANQHFFCFVLIFFENSYPNRCEVISHGDFNLHFLDD